MTDAYVYSTLTSPVKYQNYVKGGQDAMIPTEHVMIHGGANVADSKFFTPRGVVTPVTNEQLEILEKNDQFQLHKRNGFIKVERRNVDPDVMAADMEGRDPSAPLVDADFQQFKDEGGKIDVSEVEIAVQKKPGRGRPAKNA